MFKRWLLISIFIHLISLLGVGFVLPSPSYSHQKQSYLLLVTQVDDRPLAKQAERRKRSGPKDRPVKLKSQTIANQDSVVKAPVEIKPFQAETEINSGESTGLVQAATDEVNLNQPMDSEPEQVAGPESGVLAEGLPNQIPAQPIDVTKPNYPSLAHRNNWEGTVVLVLTINARGKVEAATLADSSGYKILDEAAVKAAKGWRYQPATVNGVAITSTKRVKVRFQLEDVK